MTQFLDRVEAGLQQRRLLPADARILIAVSGGVDSMVLMHALHRLAKGHRWKIAVVHFNHQLRGRASAADERLVCSTARRLSLPVFHGRGEVAGFSRRSKISLEMAARQLRHEYLARIARQEKISAIALAHHADDQVELFFLRLLRGTGGEGLAGMKWSSPSPVDSKIRLVRPLLGFTKSELLQFAREHKIRFRDDATNFSKDFLRNRIRNELLPLLRDKYQPALDRVVLRLMDIVGAEAEFVSDAAARARNRRPKVRSPFYQLPLAVQRRVLQRQLAEFGLPADFELVDQLRRHPGRGVSIGPGLSAKRDSTGTVCLDEERSFPGFNSVEQNVKLAGGAGRVTFAGRKFLWTLEKYDGTRGRSSRMTERFDADKIRGRITLRHWRPGDHFQPIGMKWPVKLQDLFTNLKIGREARHKLVLAEAQNGGIFWVEQLRISEKFKLTPATRRQLIWRWQ